MANQKIKKEICRDLIALTGLVFYTLVLVRVLAAGYYGFLTKLILALVISYLIAYFLKLISINSSQSASRGTILALFLSFLYESYIFAVFVVMLSVAVFYSIIYLKKATGSEVIYGILLGIISSALAYWIHLIS